MAELASTADAEVNSSHLSLAGALFFIGGIWGLLSIPIAEGTNPNYNVSADSVSGLGVPYFSHLPVTCTALPSCAIPVQPASAVIVLSFFVGGVLTILAGYLLLKAMNHRLFGLGVAVTGVLLFILGMSYVPFYLGTPTSDVIDAALAMHGFAAFGAFIIVFILAFYAYRFTRGPFMYISPILGAIILVSFLLDFSGYFLGVGFGGMERVLIYSLDIWTIGFGAYLLGASGLD